MAKRVFNLRKNPSNIQDANIISYIDYKNFDKAVNEIEKAKLKIYDSALKSQDPLVMQRALTYFKQETGAGKIKSMLIDPMDFMSSFGYKEKPTRLTYLTLKRMAATPFTAITINTRVSQIVKFCTPQEDEYTVGFKIRLKNRKEKLTYEDEKNIESLTDFILDGGFNGYQWGRDDFENFVSKLVRDSLTFDQYTFEILENKKGIPQEFHATDASTYRVASTDEKTMEAKLDPLTGQECYPNLVQIYNGVIENEFYPWELCFGVRRPRTDLLVAGYGYAELEELVNIVTSMLYSDEYNRRFFSQGSAPKGIIKISSNAGINDEALKDFKRQWQAQMSGVYNSWKTPVMEADKMEWIDLSKNNRDMEYSAWQEYLIKIHSALFLIDPSEMGFDIHRSGDSNPMFEGDQMKRIKYSRDKGLTPLLKNIAKSINRHLIWRINKRYEFVFVGGEESEDQALEKAIKELTNFKKVDEVRSKFGLEQLGEENGGNLILNPQWMIWYNNKVLREAQEKQDLQEKQDGQDFGEEDNVNYEPLPDNDDEPDMYEKAIIDEAQNPFLKDLNDYVKKIGK